MRVPHFDDLRWPTRGSAYRVICAVEELHTAASNFTTKVTVFLLFNIYSKQLAMGRVTAWKHRKLQSLHGILRFTISEGRRKYGF